MPFNTFILNCLCSRDTSFCELGTGTKLQIKPTINEIALFFVIDDQSNKRSTVRKDFGIEGGLCDLAIFYTDKSVNENTICLAELKGRHLDDAVAQITNTHNAFKRAFNQRQIAVNWKAYVLSNSKAPKNIKKLQSDLEKIFGKKCCRIGRDSDIGKFLRGENNIQGL